MSTFRIFLPFGLMAAGMVGMVAAFGAGSLPWLAVSAFVAFVAGPVALFTMPKEGGAA